ncbi:phosphate ABC transporter permease PstA [Halorarum halophilum]|uniref:Phosphate transport system permease protein PstA n=1 Tax=Halorarum halophilum TaxID=2743090 RepID=A0A7D5GBU1_9EURY|nr:phosphate ABC transporter permease PstA [Halobaculum halophilum]QLG27685.1 phosphate ABC transporter permease PstA [Halobaculum halophilum]
MTAAESAESRDTEFGSVSQVKGVAFEYLTLAASLVGIVALAVLLGYVSADALGVGPAEPAWFLVFLLTLVVPAIGFVWYAARTPGVADVLERLVVRVIGGAELAVALVVLFIVSDVQFWFLLYTVGVVPAAALVLYGRVADDPRVEFPVPLVVLVVGLLAGYLLKGPVDTFPIDVLIALWMLGVPVASYFGLRWRARAGTVAGVLVGLGILAGATAAGFGLAAVSGLGPEAGFVVALTPGVLVASYAAEVALDEPVGRRGLLFPVVLLVGALLGQAVVTALGLAGPEPWLDAQFLTSAPSRFAEQAGLYPAIIGSVFIISLVAVFSFVFGVGCAVYLEEYAPQSGYGGMATNVVQVNIANLAGVPSVVYGLLGLGIFVNLIGLGFGIVLVAAMTLSLLILPIVIISSQEAIRSVPDSQRQAAYGMGATRWQTVKSVVIPEAVPGILTGSILALGRAIGETAPLIIIGLPTTVFNAPTGLFGKGSAMPMTIYGWAFLPDEAFREGVLAAGVVTLMVILLSINSVAIYVRNNYQRGS